MPSRLDDASYSDASLHHADEPVIEELVENDYCQLVPSPAKKQWQKSETFERRKTIGEQFKEVQEKDTNGVFLKYTPGEIYKSKAPADKMNAIDKIKPVTLLVNKTQIKPLETCLDQEVADKIAKLVREGGKPRF